MKLEDEKWLGVRAPGAGMPEAAPGLAVTAAEWHETIGSSALLDSRALNQAFLVVTYTTDGRIRYANPQFLRSFGYELGEVLTLEASAFISSTLDRYHQIGLWARAGAGEAVRETGLWISRAGEEIWLDSRFLPMTGPDGRVEAVVQVAEDVTRRLAREAEERGQVDALNASHAVAHFAMDGTIVWVNDALLRSSGYTADELLGARHDIFLCDDADRAAARELWAGLGRSQNHSGECRRRAKDGSVRWWYVAYTPILDPARRPVKVVMYASDVTERRARQVDHQWQITAIHKSNCVVTFDMNGSILDANDRFLDATGYTMEEVRGRHHRMFVDGATAHGADYALFWADLRRGHYRSGQYKRVGKDGSDVWLQATYNPIFDAGGTPVRVVKYASVVTDECLLQAEHQGQIAAINHSQCVISFGLDGTVLDANENFLSLMGYRYAEVQGCHHRIFVQPGHADTPEYLAFWKDLAGGAHRSGEFKRLTKDGREIWLQATYSPIRDLNGRFFKVVKYAVDITAEKLRQADFQGQIEAINKSQDVVVFALDGTIVDANERFLQTVGYARDQLVGQHHAMLVERETAASRDYVEFWNTLRAGGFQSGLYKRLGKGGREIWIQASYNPILDVNGKTAKIVKFASDVTANIEMAEAFAAAKKQALLDSATSLPNRAKLSAFMTSHLAESAGSMAVLYIDLDHFKRINEAHGQRVGDLVLAEVADRLRRSLRADQLVARVGADEFVIAAPGMQQEGIERLCKLLYERMLEPIVGEGDLRVAVGMSIGIAIAPIDGATPDELLRAADVALLRSKQSGRGIRSYVSAELNERLYGQRKLVEDMRNSLVAGDFYLQYQPRFCTRTRRMRSAEALVRWRHPERGRVNPADFIPLAEQSGLIVPLGDWILRTACITAARWPGIGISVNLSPVQLGDRELVRKIREVLAATGLPPSRLELEVTEGMLIEDEANALQVLGELKNIGVSLSIDDFGTGYSSMASLRNFPFDVLKIDRSFVRDLHAASSSRPVVRAIVALGRALGLSVTAEGVETTAQLDVLAEEGCDEVQGFLLGMPGEPDDIGQMAAQTAAATPSDAA